MSSPKRRRDEGEMKRSFAQRAFKSWEVLEGSIFTSRVPSRLIERCLKFKPSYLSNPGVSGFMEGDPSKWVESVFPLTDGLREEFESILPFGPERGCSISLPTIVYMTLDSEEWIGGYVHRDHNDDPWSLCGTLLIYLEKDPEVEDRFVVHDGESRIEVPMWTDLEGEHKTFDENPIRAIIMDGNIKHQAFYRGSGKRTFLRLSLAFDAVEPRVQRNFARKSTEVPVTSWTEVTSNLLFMLQKHVFDSICDGEFAPSMLPEGDTTRAVLSLLERDIPSSLIHDVCSIIRGRPCSERDTTLQRLLSYLCEWEAEDGKAMSLWMTATPMLQGRVLGRLRLPYRCPFHGFVGISCLPLEGCDIGTVPCKLVFTDEICLHVPHGKAQSPLKAHGQTLSIPYLAPKSPRSSWKFSLLRAPEFRYERSKLLRQDQRPGRSAESIDTFPYDTINAIQKMVQGRSNMLVLLPIPRDSPTAEFIKQVETIFEPLWCEPCEEFKTLEGVFDNIYPESLEPEKIRHMESKHATLIRRKATEAFSKFPGFLTVEELRDIVARSPLE
jgi:hypothetical protein